MTNEERFVSMAVAFGDALGRHPNRVHERTYVLAGHGVVLRILGDRLALRVTPALAHLVGAETGAVRTELRVDLWDEAETDVAPDIDLRPDLLGVSSQYEASADGRFVTSVLQFSQSVIDREAEHIVGAVQDARRMTLYEIGRPLHVPLSLWFTDRSIPLVHAGFVADKDAGVLLIGESGAGKTTSTLACLQSGWGYLSDDLAALEIRDDGTAWGHSVYASAFVDGGTIARVGSVPGMLVDGAYPYEDKRLLILPAGADGPLRARARIRAVGLLRISASPATRFRRLRQGEALLEMLRDGLQIGVLHPGRAGLRCLGDLAERVPAYRVDLGTEAAEIPTLLRAMITEAQRASREGEPR
jgi:hypothetical protein